MSTIDLLDGAFAALRQRPRVMVTIVAGTVVPVSLFQGWLTRDDLGGATFGELLNDPTIAQEVSATSSLYDAGFFVGLVLGMLVTAVAGVGISRVVYGWFEGRDVTAKEALGFTMRRLGAILGAFAVIHLLQLIGLVLLIVPGLMLIVLSSLTSPVLAIEQLGPVASMRRSWELVRRRTGPVVGLLLLMAVVQYGVSQAVGTMLELGALLLGPDRAWPLVAFANLVTQLILVPVNGATMCLIYLDIRFRTEGLDLHRRFFIELGAP